MYVPPAFQIDRKTSLAFAAAQGFGTACAFDGSRPVASPLPFDLDYRDDGTPQASFHVARGNPLASCADGAGAWLLAVTGPHAYVSPHWYASPDQVPTWLYQTVHLTGPVRRMSDTELVDNLGRLSGRFEAPLAPKPAWTMAEMTTGRREMMLRAITGLVMTVEHIEGSFKLNQSKSNADCLAVAAALSAQPIADARQIAELMVAAHPQREATTSTMQVKGS